jgi:hypothetical protein
MPASWSYSTSTYDDPSSGASYYNTVTEHIITVDLPSYSAGSFFVDSVNPHGMTGGLAYTFNISNLEAFTLEYFEAANTEDINPDLHSARHHFPFYQLTPAPPSGPGSSGYTSIPTGHALDGSGNVYAPVTKLIFRVNAALFAITPFYSGLTSSIFAVAIPPSIQALLSGVLYNVPPTHMLLVYQAASSGTPTIDFVRYTEPITTESKYLASSYDARINKPSPSGAPAVSYLIERYIACYRNGDTYLSYYPFHNVRETTSGGRVVFYDYQVFPGVVPTSLDLTVTYNDKNNALISTQSISASYSTIKPNHYIAEIDSALSIPSLCTSVGVAANYGSAVGILLLHPGHSPLPCQEVDGGWLPGVVWKV